jgi:uncharacterized protein with HEPN domain
MQRDIVTLLDILQAARLILQFTAGMHREDFIEDEKTNAAVIREVEIIGEATKRLSADFREAHSAIPWREMAGMRDVLIHAYDSVDLDELWFVVEVSIPELIALIEPLIPKEDN